MIVVIEDDDGMRQAVRRIVVLQGFKAETFATAEAFLASKTAARAKCLVLDIRLPGLSGIELYRQLHERGCATPAIFMTAQDDVSTRRAVTALASPYLVKPFSSEALVDAIDTALGRARGSA